VLVGVFIVEICYTYKFISRMNTIDTKASKGETNVDQLEVSRAQATWLIGLFFQIFALFRGLLYLGWTVSYWCVVFRFQNKYFSDYDLIC
jgi:hypothetical protein